jgi:hypothetical protein
MKLRGMRVSYIGRKLMPLLLAALVGACGLVDSPHVANLWSIHGQPTGGSGGAALDNLATQVPEAAQLDVYYVEFDVPYAQVFAATVKVLKEHGDVVQLANSDLGYIGTNPSQHWPLFVDSYSTQYLIAFEKLSAGRTRIIFKVLRWTLEFDATDNLQRSPLTATLDLDSRVQQGNANDFALLLRKQLQ